MSNPKVVIYISRSLYRHKTLQFQENFCRRFCHVNGFTDVTLFVEDSKEKTVLHDLIHNISSYNYLLMYSLCVLSEKGSEIENYMQQIFQTDTKLLIPIFGVSKNNTHDARFMNTIMISMAINENGIWKDIIKGKVKDTPYVPRFIL